MVVVGNRVEAVRWQLAMQKYIATQKYQFSAQLYSATVGSIGHMGHFL